MKNGEGLRFHIGAHSHDQFKLTLDGEDITDRVHVRSLKLSLGPDTGHTLMELEVYATGVEAVSKNVSVKVIKEERFPLWSRFMDWLGR